MKERRKWSIETEKCSGKDFIAALDYRKKRVVDFAAMRFNRDEFVLDKISHSFGFIEPKDGISSTEVLTEIAHLGGIVDASVKCALPALKVLTPDDFAQLGVEVILIMHRPISDHDGYVDRMGIVNRDGVLKLLTYDDGKSGNKWHRNVGFLYVAFAFWRSS